MASKDLRPEQRLGKGNPKRIKMIFWTVGLLACGSGLYAAYHYASATEVEIPVARARMADFIISVRTRGDIKSTRSVIITAPQVPSLRIVRLAHNGQEVHKGDTVVEFDAETTKQNIITRTNSVDSAQGSIDQTKATQAMTNESYAYSKIQSEFALEQSKLEAGKAAVLSVIDGEKARITVGVSDGSLQTVRAQIDANNISNDAVMVQLNQAYDKNVRDLKLSQSYMDMMVLKAPVNGVVNLLTNFRSTGTFGRAGAPPFKEGDNVWTGAQIMEIPDLSSMYVDLKLDEVDRGKIALGQTVRVRVDSIPDKDFTAELDFISPAAALVFTGVGANAQASTEKNFPARATLKSLDDRLRPGTSSSVEIIVEREPNRLLIPLRASFDKGGKPAVYVQKADRTFAVRPIQIGKHNDEDLVVTGGLREGETVALEDPVKLAKQAKKKI
jgi:multidrug efflux pump subunit AcrA (membrane-fusion protein)